MATNVTVQTRTVSAAGPSGSIVRRLRSIVRRWQESARIYGELSQMNSRELADLGLSASDIPDVANGKYRRP